MKITKEFLEERDVYKLFNFDEKFDKEIEFEELYNKFLIKDKYFRCGILISVTLSPKNIFKWGLFLLEQIKKLCEEYPDELKLIDKTKEELSKWLEQPGLGFPEPYEHLGNLLWSLDKPNVPSEEYEKEKSTIREKSGLLDICTYIIYAVGFEINARILRISPNMWDLVSHRRDKKLISLYDKSRMYAFYDGIISCSIMLKLCYQKLDKISEVLNPILEYGKKLIEQQEKEIE